MKLMLLPVDVLVRDGDGWAKVLGVAMDMQILVEADTQKLISWAEVQKRDWIWPRGLGFNGIL